MTKDTLFNQLMTIVETSEKKSFFFKDFELDDVTYRIFNYHLCSYTEFLEPGALECRGIMFEMNDGECVRIASRPMPKFFNLHEVSPCINTLAEALVRQGRLSQDVYEKAKKRSDE